MNILFLSDYFSTWNIGGASRVLASQIEALKAHSDEFDFQLLSGYPGDPRRESHDFRWVHFEYKREGFLSNLWASLKAIGANGNIDILHIHQPLIGLLAVWAVPQHSVKLYHFHSFWEDEKMVHAGESGPKKLLSAFKGWLERKALFKMNHFIVLSEYSKRRLSAVVPAAKITIIPGSVKLPPLEPRHCNGSGELSLLSVRRLEPRMGLDLLILAIASLKSRDIVVNLDIVGRGREKENLLKLISEHGLEEQVRLLGRLSQEDLDDQMKSHHGMVLPTKSLEGFGMSVIEAFAAGLPVLATKVGALVEFEKHEGAFYSIEHPDVESIAQGIERVMHPWREVEERTKTCRDVAETYYSHEIMSKKLIQLYRELK